MGTQVRKDIKQLQSESRQTRKRKRNETVTDLPEADHDIGVEEVSRTTTSNGREASEVQERPKKRKKGKSEGHEGAGNTAKATTQSQAVDERQRTIKPASGPGLVKGRVDTPSIPLDSVALAKAKQREKNKKAKEKRKAAARAQKTSQEPPEPGLDLVEKADVTEKSPRFIVFIGEYHLHPYLIQQ